MLMDWGFKYRCMNTSEDAKWTATWHGKNVKDSGCSASNQCKQWSKETDRRESTTISSSGNKTSVPVQMPTQQDIRTADAFLCMQPKFDRRIMCAHVTLPTNARRISSFLVKLITQHQYNYILVNFRYALSLSNFRFSNLHIIRIYNPILWFEYLCTLPYK